MLGAVKNYLWVIVSLLIALIVARFVLGFAKKAPVVGGVAEKIEELSGLE
jgi:hypothetical protein